MHVTGWRSPQRESARCHRRCLRASLIMLVSAKFARRVATLFPLEVGVVTYIGHAREHFGEGAPTRLQQNLGQQGMLPKRGQRRLGVTQPGGVVRVQQPVYLWHVPAQAARQLALLEQRNGL